MRNLLSAIRRESEYDLKSPQQIYRVDKESNIQKWFWIIALILAVVLLMPWTQNIQVTGTVTTLYQDQRPQQLNSIILAF